MLDAIRTRIVTVQTGTTEAKPQGAIAVAQQGADDVARDAVRVGRVVYQRAADLAPGIEKCQPATVGCNPQAIAVGCSEPVHEIVAQRRRVAALAPVLLELVTIEAVQAVFGAEPHKAFRVLVNADYGILREAFFLGQPLEAHGVRVLRCLCRENRENYGRKGHGKPCCQSRDRIILRLVFRGHGCSSGFSNNPGGSALFPCPLARFNLNLSTVAGETAPKQGSIQVPESVTQRT